MAARRLLALALAPLVAAACGDDPASGASSGDSTHGSGTGANGSGASNGSGGGSSGGGESGGSSQVGGTGGGIPACVTDVVPLAEQGQNYDCSFALAPEHVDADINLVLEIGGGSQVICWRASSQGCDVGGFPGGWWYSGDGVLLCDSTCTSLIETAGTKLYLWVGCPNDTCLD